MELGLADRHALVTGGAAGIGLATARLLSSEGAVVGVLDRDATALATAISELTAAGGSAYPLKADVTDPEAVRRAFDVAAQRTPLDILVINAGVYHFAATEQTPPDEWDRVQDINLRGAFLCIHTALPRMKQRRAGSIVCIASLAGRSGGLRAGTAYASSKSGLIGLCRALAIETAAFGIRVNCVNPGVIDTPMTRESFPADARDAITGSHPMRRWGRPEEVAAAVCFLASPAASWISGAQLDVNGGAWPAP